MAKFGVVLTRANPLLVCTYEPKGGLNSVSFLIWLFLTNMPKTILSSIHPRTTRILDLIHLKKILRIGFGTFFGILEPTIETF